MPNHLTITAYSTALFSTWIFVEEMRLLLDAGDGVSASLLTKSRKIDTVAITHPDRDHITGLFQLLQLNAHDGKPQIIYPKDSGSFPAMAEFCRKFDPHVSAATWTPVAPGQEIALKDSLKLRVVNSSHIDRPGQVKSVGYQVVSTARKLKPEYRGRPQNEMAELARTHGTEALTDPHEEIEIGYSGDTGVDSPERWRGCRVLIHEATFLQHTDAGQRGEHNQHSVLPDVLRMAVESNPGALILNHFSSRYKAQEIAASVGAGASAITPPFTIYVIPPGEVVRDVLSQAPVWPGGGGATGA
jgi:ribonuclease Z